MATISKNPVKIKRTKAGKPNNYCKCCDGLIPKTRTTSWPIYSMKSYCGDTCRILAQGKRQRKIKDKLANEIKLADGTVMPIAGYIGAETEEGRLMADLYIGALKAVKAVDDKKELDLNAVTKGVICSFKGVPISLEYVKAATDWLTSNWLGKPGQRREEVKEPEMSRDELMAGIRSFGEKE